MKKLIHWSVVVALMTVMTASIGQGAATAELESTLDFSCPPGTGVFNGTQYYEHYAAAASGQDFDPSSAWTAADVFDEDGPAAGWREAHAGGASAVADGTYNSLGVWSLAASAPGIAEGAYSSAYQGMWFGVRDSGEYTLTADFMFSGDLMTQCLGDTASGSGLVSMDVWDWDSNYLGGDSASVLGGVADGVSDLTTLDATGQLSFSGYFSSNIDYYVELWADAEALASSSACAIPAPGAIVLVGLGSGLVGWMRRRKTV